MKSVRVLAALGAVGLVSLPVSAQAQSDSGSTCACGARLSISSFFTPAFGGNNPAFGGNNNPAFGGVSIRPRIVIRRITPTHPLPGFPIRRGRPVPPRSNAAT